MQVRTISPSLPDTFPVRRSRTRPEHRRPTQVWQIPMRQPNGERGAGLLAGDEDRRAAVRRAPRSPLARKEIAPPVAARGVAAR